MDFNEREAPLAIHAPRGTGDNIRSLLEAAAARPSFRVRLNEVGDGDVALDRPEYEIRCFETDHDTRSIGFALVEDERKGRFDRERAEEIGVPVGPKFQRLHAGNSVELEDGTVVQSEQVVGESRPGRTFVYTGDTRPADRTASVAEGADLLIHDATFGSDNAIRARRTAHSTAAEAGALAKNAGVSRLALVHVSSRYADNVSFLEREAREAFEADDAFVPDDGETVSVPYPNSDPTPESS